MTNSLPCGETFESDATEHTCVTPNDVYPIKFSKVRFSFLLCIPKKKKKKSRIEVSEFAHATNLSRRLFITFLSETNSEFREFSFKCYFRKPKFDRLLNFFFASPRIPQDESADRNRLTIFAFIQRFPFLPPG